MYYIPGAILAKQWMPPDAWQSVGKAVADFPNLTWYNFFVVNLVPVTLGNIVGGSLLVGFVYWFAYRRKHGWEIRF